MHHRPDLGPLLFLVRPSHANVTQILESLGRAVDQIAVERVPGMAAPRNNRIIEGDFLNRSCAFDDHLELILLGDPLKIFFQQHRSTTSKTRSAPALELLFCNATTAVNEPSSIMTQAPVPKTAGSQETSMTDSDIRATLDQHWAASDANDFELEHQIYREDAVLEYPQSGERIRGRRNIQITRTLQPSRKRFKVRRVIGAGDLWVTEYVILYDGQPSYTVSIMEFEGGKVARETQYFGDPFEASAWRSRWVEPMEKERSLP